MHIIEANMAPNATLEELRSLSESEIRNAERYFEESDISDGASLSLSAGVFVFSETQRVPFSDYETRVIASYRTEDKDRWFITTDGGHVNVTQLVRDLREAVENARS